MRGWEKEDTGAIIRDVFKSLNNEGICVESYCKYDISKFAEKPTLRSYKNGLKHRTATYASVQQDVIMIKQTLMSGACISFGFDVYDNFYNADISTTNYIMPLPNTNSQLVGRHATTIIGWEDSINCFLIQNSWGVNWGKKGLFYMPYSFIIDTNHCFDFWCIESIR